MKYCDLHNHSTHSDGSYTPRELVEYACEKGLCALALTDHNNVSGMDEFFEAAREMNLNVVLGSELTTDYNGKEIHLLSLFINEENRHRVQDFLEKQLVNKRASNVTLEKNLQAGGYDISLKEMHEKYGVNLNRAHFARTLVDKGYFENTEIAFDSVLKCGNGFYIPPIRVDFIEAISLVKSWGCVPVMAHPLLSVTKEELEKILPTATEKGLAGIEVYYPKFDAETRNYLHSLCQKYNLIASGGSDFHGTMKSQGDLNEAKAPYECYERLLDAFNKMK